MLVRGSGHDYWTYFIILIYVLKELGYNYHYDLKVVIFICTSKPNFGFLVALGVFKPLGGHIGGKRPPILQNSKADR